MISALLNSFKIPELKKRILVALALLAVYRLGCYIPTPGIDGAALGELFRRISSTEGGALFGIMNMFSGGAMSRMTIFALGIMPYISCSIIMQLLTAVVPAFEKLAKEGKSGHQKITQYTRYGTVVLSVIQSYFVALWVEGLGRTEGLPIVMMPGWSFRLVTILTLTTGTIFIMWLGEQIQEHGIGNGISLVITAGIISRIPSAGYQLWVLFSPYSPAKRTLEPYVFLIMIVLLLGVILAITMVIQAQRRIPVQYARRVVGRKVYGGQSTYIPLKIDQSGIIAIIFAQSIILFPATIATFIPNQAFHNFANSLMRGHWVYTLVYSLLIIFFCYFYTAIVFNPLDISENMKKYGGFIPGIRPGKPTAEYLDFVMTRITLAGAVFMAFIAIFPDFIMAWLKIPYLVASFFGGTGLLIVIGVMLDTVKQIESHLLMRNYEGFLKSSRIKGRR
ncbi:MAG: preprotein translocase subunit SecY [Candidatus Omnitrophica bacterium CG1_02_44_16]|nr:MAG: preprotein translocase subunit SecY [Candidatus Omnitrophica bacterium CG1_02_44_16]PIY82807.1 MAG: preprotein translocase subunit SecY [Candidatus Omnitrophica bacterium CG_4_10_14_0_8_um_filter_44_12]PIZ84054.1 MAG: preprotein translocase subunit SecY [Candidatus Omnitrophica bacterium CG_4_10_14_0_2_um_filter_44_9]